jgi:geranylgeranyl diphosphate synthase type II
VAVSADVDVEGVLRDTARVVRRRMLDALPDAEPHDHLWRLVREYPARPGKALRPALCLATCRAFGGDDQAALPVAVSMELLHNAFLVHDDIADGSLRRRGRPTLSATHGLGLALNAGDALMVVAYRELRHHLRTLDADLADRVLEELDTMALRTLEGQATELGWQRDSTVAHTPEDYLELIMHKTCWYTTIHPLRVGALLGAGGSASLQPMIRFGFHLGAAFQIQDDVLNLVGDADVYGKEIDGDLWEGKRTLMLIHLESEVRGPDQRVLRRYLDATRAERTEAQVREVRSLMDRYGSITYATEYAQGVAAVAHEAFEEAFAAARPGPDTDFVRALIPYMLDRRV